MLYVLDTSVLLQGGSPPPGQWVTTPEAEAEVRPGGRDARRFMYWREAGLEVRSAGPRAWADVDEAAAEAGNLDRLSEADRSVLALALQSEATLLTDDHTVLDVARRLGIRTSTIQSGGIQHTQDFRPRCTGCGRWFESGRKGDCPVCGSPLKLRPAGRPAGN